jgi:CO/xanthine dehydrogenase FAD-binding subunit
MKPAPFDYVVPDSLGHALELVGDEARPLAGGQSLVPLLNFRLARPAALVDLNALERELGYLREEGGSLRIGALTRQAAVERSALVAERWPLLRQAVSNAGHPQIRSRGTVGGSVAHADPTAELPAALLALDARFHVRSSRSARTIEAAEMFVGPLTTALEPDELLVEIEVPALPDGVGTAFAEHARTHGDFAIAGAAAVVAPGRAAIAVIGTGPVPVRAADAERAAAAGAGAAEAGELASVLVEEGPRRALIAALVRESVARAAA